MGRVRAGPRGQLKNNPNFYSTCNGEPLYIVELESDMVKWHTLGKLNGSPRQNSPLENYLRAFCFQNRHNGNGKY